MARNEKQLLLTLFKERALRWGDFTLASGKKSKYYIDSKQVTFHPQGSNLCAKLILDLIKNHKIDAVGGMALGAVPIACAVSALSVEVSSPVPAFTVRKESKGHGTQKRIEGYLRPGWKVILLEDVVSTGGSTLQAIGEVEKTGAEVVKVVALLDRLMGGKERLAEAGYSMESLFTRQDLGIE